MKFYTFLKYVIIICVIIGIIDMYLLYYARFIGVYPNLAMACVLAPLEAN